MHQRLTRREILGFEMLAKRAQSVLVVDARVIDIIREKNADMEYPATCFPSMQTPTTLSGWHSQDPAAPQLAVCMPRLACTRQTPAPSDAWW